MVDKTLIMLHYLVYTHWKTKHIWEIHILKSYTHIKKLNTHQRTKTHPRSTHINHYTSPTWIIRIDLFTILIAESLGNSKLVILKLPNLIEI